MSQRNPDRSNQPRQARAPTASPRRGASPVLGLQRTLGNRGTTRVLARKGSGNFENSVQIGKLGPIEITESNVADWIAGKASAEDLVATTTKGKHSDELQRMADSKARVDSIEVTALTGQNTWIIVTFRHAVIKGYAADPAGKTESWKAVRFEAVDIKRTAVGKPRP